MERRQTSGNSDLRPLSGSGEMSDPDNRGSNSELRQTGHTNESKESSDMQLDTRPQTTSQEFYLFRED